MSDWLVVADLTDEPDLCAGLARATAEGRTHIAVASRLDRPMTDLEALAEALENEELELDPASAIACRRFVNEPEVSPLIDETASLESLRAAISRLRAGLRPRALA